MDIMNNSEKKNGLEPMKSRNELHKQDAVPEAIQAEFGEAVTAGFKLENMSGLSRRKFMALMGASSAFAAASCTEYRDNGELMPYNKKPESITPGTANHYASTYTGNGHGWGILIKTREGRPVKIDGNPLHPINKGKIDSAAHASILNLYDPSRIKNPKRMAVSDMKLNSGQYQPASWDDADTEIIASLGNAAKSRKEIAIVIPAVASPSQKRLFDEFAEAYPTARFYTLSTFADKARQKAWEKCYGRGSFPVINWEKANIILSLNSDFLGNEGNTPEQIAKFASRRDADKPDEFNRLYVAEGAMSLTGSNADYRLRITPEAQLDLVFTLLNELCTKGQCSIACPLQLQQQIKKYTINGFAANYKVSAETLGYLLDDLMANKGKAIVYAGDCLPESVHIAVNILNAALGNDKIYDPKITNTTHSLNREGRIDELPAKMNSGKVSVLILLDSNPAYMLPDDYRWDEAAKKVPMRIAMLETENESSDGFEYILPIHHNFESWGDSHARSNVYGLMQPVIQPLYDSRQKEAALLTWTAAGKEAYTYDIYHKYVMDYWRKKIYPALNLAVDFNTFWYSALHDGFAMSNQSSHSMPVINISAAIGLKSISNQNFTVVLQPSHSLGDGTYANNGWLQELPHPITKVTWDNYAAIAPQTAAELGVEMNDLVEVSIGGRGVTLPVVVQPGMAEKLVAVELGYGRTDAGEIGNNVGVDASVLMTKQGGIADYIFTGASVKKAEGTYKLASTQEHHNLTDDMTKDFQYIRDIIREASVGEYKKNPKMFEHLKHEFESITADIEYPGIKWAMAIDLNKCIGCTQCTTTCNVENNIPVVGKDQVAEGREMHWMRIDRYYGGTPEEPIVRHQPMNCQHCDNAPCENVCPVVATNHSPDGLNQMIYNRCVGTRYCANNCPYKVRRFNFFDFRDHVADSYYKGDSMDLLHNPEVTIRARGVMEKCTFCVQRLSEAKSNATRDGVEFKGEKVTTACEDACPANAITFGNMNDKQSDIAQMREHNLGYYILDILNVKPNVTYLSRLKNTKSEDDITEKTKLDDTKLDDTKLKNTKSNDIKSENTKLNNIKPEGT